MIVRLMRSRRLRVAALLGLLALVVASAATVALSGANFSAQTQNANNTFQAAASFSNLRVASGTYSGDGLNNRSIKGAGFQPDLVIVKAATNQISVARSTTMGAGDVSKPMTGATALAANRIKSLDANGFTVGTDNQVNQSGTTYYWTAFKGAPGEMAVGSYTGNGGASQAIAGLGFSPEYAAVLPATAQRATQRYNGMTRGFQFDQDTGTTTRVTSLDANGFTVGNSTEVNQNATSYHYVAFSEVAGRIDTGGYTGTGATQDITAPGFQPGYVMVRANDTVTARRGNQRSTPVPGNQSLYWANVANSTTGITALLANGFRVGTDTAVNANATSYHYLGVKDSGTCTNPGAQTVTASKDAYVDQASSGTNYGGSPDLFVQSKTGSANQRTLVGFNLPSIPAGCTVTGAYLRMFSSAAVNGRTIEAYRAGGSWTESGAGGVTWSTAPTAAGAAATAPSGTGWREWDVLSQVQTMYSPGPDDGFLLKDQTENAAASPQQKYESKENTNDPQLVVTFG